MSQGGPSVGSGRRRGFADPMEIVDGPDAVLPWERADLGFGQRRPSLTTKMEGDPRGWSRLDEDGTQPEG